MSIDGLKNILGILPVKHEREAGQSPKKDQKKDQYKKEEKDENEQKEKESRIDIRI